MSCFCLLLRWVERRTMDARSGWEVVVALLKRERRFGGAFLLLGSIPSSASRPMLFTGRLAALVGVSPVPVDVVLVVVTQDAFRACPFGVGGVTPGTGIGGLLTTLPSLTCPTPSPILPSSLSRVLLSARRSSSKLRLSTERGASGSSMAAVLVPEEWWWPVAVDAASDSRSSPMGGGPAER